MRFLAAALIALLLVAGCGDGGSSVAPTGPAPRLPLTWTDVPDSLTVQPGETVSFTATLSAAVDARVEINAHEPSVEVSGELIRPGVFRGTVTGVGLGAVGVTLIATYPGYHRADATVDVSVGATFDEEIWRHMVFDEGDCPDSECSWYDGTDLEDRAVWVLPFMPNFHVVDDPSVGSRPEGLDRFSGSEMAALKSAIRDAVEQLTGQRFTGEITSSSEPREEYGWVDVLPVTDEWFDGMSAFPRIICGSAKLGATTGQAVLNVEWMRQDPGCPARHVMLHELGHALGFHHIRGLGGFIMGGSREPLDAFTLDEQFHALLAHEVGRGTRYTLDPFNQSSRASQLRRFPERPDITIYCPLH